MNPSSYCHGIEAYVSLTGRIIITIFICSYLIDIAESIVI